MLERQLLSMFCIWIDFVIYQRKPYPHGNKHHQEEKEAVGILGTIDCISLSSLKPEKSCEEATTSQAQHKITAALLKILQLKCCCLH